MKTSKEKIQAFLKNAMIQKERDDKTKFLSFNEDTEFKPYWELIKSKLFNSGFEIRDSNYSFLSEGFDAIDNYLRSNDDLKNFEIYEYCEPDVYNSDLLKWVSENLNNASYVDDAISEYGITSKVTLWDLLQMGQRRHKEELFNMALSVVNMLWETFEEEQDIN